MNSSQLESFIFEKIADSKLPGVSAALVMNDEIVWSRAFGFRDIERGLGATTHSLYCIGSVTKSFTALAIMQLAEQEKLSLDDAIDKFVPFDLKPHGEPIRIWHLLSHTSGIPALAYAEAVIRSATGASESWLPMES